MQQFVILVVVHFNLLFFSSQLPNNHLCTVGTVLCEDITTCKCASVPERTNVPSFPFFFIFFFYSFEIQFSPNKTQHINKCVSFRGSGFCIYSFFFTLGRACSQLLPPTVFVLSYSMLIQCPPGSGFVQNAHTGVESIFC